MTISFNELPTTTRLPFAYTEFDPTRASLGPTLNPYTVLLVGQSLPTGTAAAHSVNRPMSKEQANSLFGRGSQLAAWASEQSEVLPDRATLEALARRPAAR